MIDFTTELGRVSDSLDSVKLHALRLVANSEFYDSVKVDAIYEDLRAIKDFCDEAWRQAYKITESAKSENYKLEARIEESLASERR